jgi:hypothetical protein
LSEADPCKCGIDVALKPCSKLTSPDIEVH